jgi:hypothetical protein
MSKAAPAAAQARMRNPDFTEIPPFDACQSDIDHDAALPSTGPSVPVHGTTKHGRTPESIS